MRKALKRVGKWVGMGGGFLLVANAKAVVSALGLDKVAANPSVLGWIVSAITSPAAYAVGLVFFGVGVAVGLDWLARQWDANHPSADERLKALWPDMYDISETILNELQRGQAIPSMGLASRVAAKYTTLKKLGMSAPLVPPTGRYWFSTNKLFIDQIVPVLREGHVPEARGLARHFVEAIEQTTPEGRAKVEDQLNREFDQSLPF